MKTRNIWSAILIVAAAAAVGCGGATEVHFGAVLSLQGSAASYGTSIQRGIELAVEEINAAGGVDVAQGGTLIPLTVTVRDAQSDAQVGRQVSQELIAMELPAVIGSDSSDVTLAIAELFEAAEIVLISPSSSSPELNDVGDFIYRNYPSDELEAVNLANHIYNVDGIHDVDVISSQSEYGLGIKNAFIARFRTLGGGSDIQVSFPAEQPDINAHLDDLRNTEAGGIYIAGYSHEVAVTARMLREAGIDLQLYGTGAILPDELVAEGGDAVEGLVFPTVAFDVDAPATAEFIAAFRAKFGSDPDVYAAHGYDAVGILVQAVEQEGLGASNISFYMNAMNPYPGAAGTTTFDENGNAQKFHRMWRIENGVAVPIEITPAGSSR